MIPRRRKFCRRRQQDLPGVQTRRPLRPVAPGGGAGRGRGPEAGPSWRTTLRAVLQVARPYFTSPDTRCESWLAVGLLLFLTLAESALAVVYTVLVGKYMTALQQRDEQGFYAGLRSFGAFIAAMLLVGCAHGYTHAMLQLRWSAALTRHYARLYLNCDGCGAFYQLTLAGDVDNPDQRIVDEASEFVDSVLGLALHMVSNILKIVSFGGLLYRISLRALTGTLAYALLGTAVVVQGFGARLMRVQHAEAAQRATLRYSLIRVRENAESIAFFGGGGSEWSRFGVSYKALLSTMYESIVLHQCLGTMLKSFGYATFAVGPLIAGPAYLRGETEFGTLTQTSMAFHAIRDGLSFFMYRLPSLSNLAMHAERLNALDNALGLEAAHAAAARQAPKSGHASISLEEHHACDRPVLRLEGLTLRTPRRAGLAQQTLLEDLSLQVDSGMSVLVVGASGIGKSSLLRGIAGLWTDGQGCVRRCGGKAAFFMPQRPYMFFGTLREQLVYPEGLDSAILDEALERVLHEVQLGYLLQRYSLEHTETWANVLSLGEQQRINFIRILLRPDLQLALIDEGTSACDTSVEEHLYRLLSRQLRSYISVGHRPALRQYHTHALWLRRRESDVGPEEGAGCCQTKCSLLPMREYESMVSESGVDPETNPVV
mmetsp:Transcript_35944/g.101193  ORF Transcript_35944/g.101193 Transcript_35944/m.101193 type:complete len:657 (-) Transcript_35944:175-2145(-)